MATTFHLIRHADNDLVGDRLAGRTPGVHLNAVGRAQAERLAERLASTPIDVLFSSPLERTRETAQPLARKLGLEVQLSDALLEINFGDWTSQSFRELDRLESWKQWNTFRSAGRAPNGESMLEVQARFVGEMERLRRRFPNRTLALFSHGDPLRAAIVYYLGLSLDLLLRLELSTASITTLAIDDWGVRFLRINEAVSW